MSPKTDVFNKFEGITIKYGPLERTLIKYIAAKYGERMGVLFLLAFNADLSIYQIVRLKRSDFQTKAGTFKKEIRTPRNRGIVLDTFIKKMLTKYFERYYIGRDNYLFVSYRTRKPISAQTLRRYFMQVKRLFKLETDISITWRTNEWKKWLRENDHILQEAPWREIRI